MNFLKNKTYKKFILVAFIGAFILFAVSAPFVHAQTKSAPTGILHPINSAKAAVTAAVADAVLGPVSPDFISSVAFGISYVIAFIFGVFIAIEAWIIGIVMNINANILQTSLVQTGFSISLAIANLAFVLGIIVIAIATILRNNTYGIKQLLWKLVVMAILVNFGLVIMSPIFAIGNSFTNYFINCINPGAGGCSQNGSVVSSFNNFGVTMAAAFNPQNPFTGPSTVTSSATLNVLKNSGISGSFNVSGLGASVGQAAVPIFGLVFTVIDLILIVVVLGAFIAMLTIRYLYISILAILLPLAWASWVFPSFSSHFKKWWDQFIRWTFFAPIVLFFVYLSLLTMKQVGGAFDLSSYTNGSTNGVWQSISSFLSSAISPIVSSFVEELLLAGMIVGGMMAANSMGIKFADTMVAVGKKGGNFVKDYTKKKTSRVVGDRLKMMGRQPDGKGGYTTTLQRAGSRLQGIPGLKGLGAQVANQGSTAVFHEGKKEEIKKYISSELKGLDDKGLITRANAPTIMLDETEAASVAQELAKRNLTASPLLKTGRMNELIGVTEKLGNVQAILNNRPELAAQTTAATPKFSTALGRMETALEGASRAIGDATKKIKVADVLDINHKSMGDHTGIAFPTSQQRDVALSMSPQQLKKLVSEGSDEQTKAFKATIEKLVATTTTPGAPPLAPAMATSLNKLYTYISGSPEWQAV